MTDFGRDISCTDRLLTGRFSSGARLVAEAAYRRLTTPRGMLRGGDDESEYGFDLSSLIGSATSKADAAALEGRIRSELLKDERIETVDVSAILTVSGPATKVDITVSATTAAGPFDLQLAVSDVSVAILGITG